MMIFLFPQGTGHEYVRAAVGDVCPNDRCIRFGWQIDMFSGYSGTTPTLWAMVRTCEGKKRKNKEKE
jgi:hypothetical protein